MLEFPISLSGYGAAVHMGKCNTMSCLVSFSMLISCATQAEEIEHASVVIPRSILASVVFNGLLGFGMLIAVLFCLGKVDDALNTSTGFPIIEIFTQASTTNAGGTIMVSPLNIF